MSVDDEEPGNFLLKRVIALPGKLIGFKPTCLALPMVLLAMVITIADEELEREEAERQALADLLDDVWRAGDRDRQYDDVSARMKGTSSPAKRTGVSILIPIMGKR